jgi:VanZ family protein
MNSSQQTHPLARTLAAAVNAQRQWQMLLFVLIGVVFYLAVAPEPPKTADLGWDKLNHMAAFAALTFAGCLSFPGARRVVFGVLPGMLALGGLIEAVQYFVPGRSCEWLDLGADAVGIACGAVLALSILALARRSAVA